MDTIKNILKEARKSRYLELVSLKQLPFLNQEQARRYQYLIKQVPRDNRFAYKEANPQFFNGWASESEIKATLVRVASEV